MADQDKTNTRQPVTDEIAVATKDIDIFAGWFGRLENPDPVLRTEANGKGLKLYDEIDRDPHAGAVLQSRYLAVTGRPWEILPGDDSAKAKEVAATVKAALEGCNFAQFCQELMQAVLFGYYGGEVMWTVRDGRIVPEKLRAKHPRRFVFSMDRELRLLTPENMISGEEVPPRKFIVFTYGSSDNPYGSGLGRKLWWPVWFKKNAIRFWLVFLEKYGTPTAVGKYPPGTDKTQQEALLEALEAIQSEAGVKIPETMTIDLLEATRGGKVTHQSLCDYMDRQISKAVLSQTASTEGTPGKLGNEETQNEVRDDIIVADSGLLAECLNETLVRWIADYNHPNLTVYPRLNIKAGAERDLNDLIARDEKLVTSIGLPVDADYFYQTYGVPAPTGKDNQVGGTRTAEFAEEQSPADTLDALSEAALEQADMDGLVDPVKRLLDEVKTLEEFRDRLLDTYADMDDSRLGDLLQRAMTVADLAGRFDVHGSTNFAGAMDGGSEDAES